MTSTNVLPGSKRRHYKSSGGTHHTYEVIGIAKHSETEEYMVVYKPLFDGEKHGYESVNLHVGHGVCGLIPLNIKVSI